MDCIGCGSTAVTERPDLTAQGYHRFRCRDCGRQFNERSDGVLNRASLPSDIIAFVVFCRLRYRLTLRDLSEILLLRGFTVSHECVRQWEAKLLPVMGEALRKRRHGTGRRSGQSWYVDETYLKVHGRWCYLYRAIDRDGNLIDTDLIGLFRDLDLFPERGAGVPRRPRPCGSQGGHPFSDRTAATSCRRWQSPPLAFRSAPQPRRRSSAGIARRRGSPGCRPDGRVRL